MAFPGTLALDDDDVTQGSTLTFTFTVAADHNTETNWIGIWPDDGSGPENDGSGGSTGSTIWAYTPGTSGSRTFSSSALRPGQWLAYYLHNDGYIYLAEPVPFTVRAIELLPEPPYLGSFGKDWLRSPAGIDLDDRGYLWVTDTFAGRVQVFDRRRRWERTVGRGVLNEPRDVAVGANRAFVVDSARQSVEVFSLSGRHLDTWAAGELGNPRGIAVSAPGEVLVSDVGNNRVARVRRGKVIGSITQDVHIPHGIAVAGDDVWVVSSSRQFDGDCVVTKFSGDHAVLTLGAGQHSKYGSLSNPAFVALHVNGDVLVTVPDFGWVNQYAVQGALRREFATRGPGLMKFPQGVAVARGGEILVADTGNHRIVTFGGAS
ncbi:MAG TPA: NHL repeat-containing protein [Nocardioides sp.]|nr:NHL repeat-containing protein [Nocardioides sp.]